MAKLKDEIKQSKPFRTQEQEVFLNVLRTAEHLTEGIASLLKPFDLSPTQYNVLRILRGAGDCGLKCGEVGERMVTRDPDVTRLLDRLEKRGLISRFRRSDDRRVVTTRITDAGLELLKQLDEPVAELHKTQLSHLGREKLKQLSELLEAARETGK